MLFIIILCLLLTLSLPQAHAGENSQSKQYTILIMGDSISAGFGIDKQQGWVALLAEKLKQQNPHYRIINASISGETTSGGANRIDNLLQQYKPNLVIIELGGNDGLRGSSIKLIKQNLSYMIEQSQQLQADVLLLGMRIPPNYGQTYSQLFAQQYQALATKHDTAIVPFLLQDIAGVDGMMQPDGIHPTQAAQKTMLNWVYQSLERI
jgi:acyl-CoA thioesterase-1